MVKEKAAAPVEYEVVEVPVPLGSSCLGSSRIGSSPVGFSPISFRFQSLLVPFRFQLLIKSPAGLVPPLPVGSPLPIGSLLPVVLVVSARRGKAEMAWLQSRTASQIAPPSRGERCCEQNGADG